ncbi:PREDICTED: uncharacterized protein LOC109580603 isoform X2 [Amphimedon queenslandica]|uniref:Uncharacterized protein n=1 Tax=Amphimedon queenslandica TaxID=400682 RepID=A0AAN0IY91_AMPQE|nr:PREDICTED: uncharacterized protein LOC109580603 isoform X2 [Amphimedon queenslandica]|eukprot:XP_019849522.1 PREDICTED: uncharacterized protein LOC109580603 isoform X2 [Amphimedon queenslandica]
MASPGSLPSLLKFVRIDKGEALSVKIHLVGGADYSWFTDIILQDILTQSCTFIKKLNTSKDKEVSVLSRSGKLRVLYHKKPSAETGGHILVPYTGKIMTGGYCLSSFGFVNVEGRKVHSFLKGRNTSAGEIYAPYKVCPHLLCVYLDPYELPDERGVIQIRQTLDPSSKCTDDVVSLFDSSKSSDNKTKKKPQSTSGRFAGGRHGTNDLSQSRLTFTSSPIEGQGDLTTRTEPIVIESPPACGSHDNNNTDQRKEKTTEGLASKRKEIPNDILCNEGWLSSREKIPTNEIKPSKRPKRNKAKGRTLETKELEPKEMEPKEMEPKEMEPKELELRELEPKNKKRQRMDEESKEDLVVMGIEKKSSDKRTGGGVSVVDSLMETANRLDQLKKQAEPVIEMTEEMNRIRARIREDPEVFVISSEDETEADLEEEEEEKLSMIESWRQSHRSSFKRRQCYKKLFNGYNDINELPELVLKKWIKLRKKTLCDIMNNKLPSERRDKFITAGARDRSGLQYENCTIMLTKEQNELITNSLNYIFCHKSTELFSFMWLVLYPEAIVHLIMDFHSLTYDQAEYKMHHYYPVKNEIDLNNVRI